jgi:omega-6 fatty acid desaturase (delta-12 desaturase)
MQAEAVDYDVVAPASSPVDLQETAADLPAFSLTNMRALRPVLQPYEEPNLRSWIQLGTALAMLVGGWVLAVWALDVHYLLTLLFSAVISVAVIRLFIIFHDCGHGSFSRSRLVNDGVGSILGVIVFTPFRYWNYAHAIHHASSSDLDRRGVGDVWTMTVEEYREATRIQRFYYRAYHSPWVMFTVGPIIKFVVIERIVTRPKTTPTRIKRSVHFTNVGIVVGVAAMVWWLGLGTYLAVQVPTLVIGGSGAIWLFYVQHRFEGTLWVHRADWNYVDAGLQGSSYLKLNPVLQYVSGNIGFHHIHHLDARIPNYRLPTCHRDQPAVAPVHTLTLRSSLHARRLKLWDEDAGHYVGYAAAS